MFTIYDTMPNCTDCIQECQRKEGEENLDTCSEDEDEDDGEEIGIQPGDTEGVECDDMSSPEAEFAPGCDPTKDKPDDCDDPLFPNQIPDVLPLYLCGPFDPSDCEGEEPESEPEPGPDPVDPIEPHTDSDPGESDPEIEPDVPKEPGPDSDDESEPNPNPEIEPDEPKEPDINKPGTGPVGTGIPIPDDEIVPDSITCPDGTVLELQEDEVIQSTQHQGDVVYNVITQHQTTFDDYCRQANNNIPDEPGPGTPPPSPPPYLPPEENPNNTFLNQPNVVVDCTHGETVLPTGWTVENGDVIDNNSDPPRYMTVEDWCKNTDPNPDPVIEPPVTLPVEPVKIECPNGNHLELKDDEELTPDKLAVRNRLTNHVTQLGVYCEHHTPVVPPTEPEYPPSITCPPPDSRDLDLGGLGVRAGMIVYPDGSEVSIPDYCKNNPDPPTNPDGDPAVVIDKPIDLDIDPTAPLPQPPDVTDFLPDNIPKTERVGVDGTPEERLLEVINWLRVRNGREPLVHDELLCSSASIISNFNKFDPEKPYIKPTHTDANGHDAPERARAQGYPNPGHAWVFENLAWKGPDYDERVKDPSWAFIRVMSWLDDTFDEEGTIIESGHGFNMLQVTKGACIKIQKDTVALVLGTQLPDFESYVTQGVKPYRNGPVNYLHDTNWIPANYIEFMEDTGAIVTRTRTADGGADGEPLTKKRRLG